MTFSFLSALLLAIAGVSYALGRSRALALKETAAGRLNSLPSYYGWFTAISAMAPAILTLALWMLLGPAVIDRMVLAALPPEYAAMSPAQIGLIFADIHNVANGHAASWSGDPAVNAAAAHYIDLHRKGFWLIAVLSIGLAAAGGLISHRLIAPTLRARNYVETVVRWILIASSTIAILITVGIVLSLIFETARFFDKVPVFEFLFGLEWSPQTALRADQVGSSGLFGAIPLFAGTFLITFLAMLVAVPVGLMSAIYMTEYASDRARKIIKPILEILAGVPTVVYGFFAALTVAPFFRGLGESIGLNVSSESALAAGVVMGVMIIPFVSSLSDDALNAVPRTMRDGSLALGATQSETIRKVLIPAALPGIVGAFLLAVSRAVGETMIVVMAAGLSANLTINPLQAVTTVTVQIVTLLTGDQEFDSAKTLAAFALGLVLFLVTLGLNVIALRTVRKYRESYE